MSNVSARGAAWTGSSAVPLLGARKESRVIQSSAQFVFFRRKTLFVILIMPCPIMSLAQVICRLVGHVCSLVAARVSAFSSDVVSMSMDGIIKVGCKHTGKDTLTRPRHLVVDDLSLSE